MPIIGGKYKNPGWLNSQRPPIDAAELNDISDTLARLDASPGIVLPSLTNPGTAGDLLAGKQLIDGDGNVLTGTMPNNGQVTEWISLGETYTIPAGYHNGSGQIIADLPQNTLILAHDSTNPTYYGPDIFLTDFSITLTVGERYKLGFTTLAGKNSSYIIFSTVGNPVAELLKNSEYISVRALSAGTADLTLRASQAPGYSASDSITIHVTVTS